MIHFKFRTRPDPGHLERLLITVFAGPEGKMQLAGNLRLYHEEWRALEKGLGHLLGVINVEIE